MTAFLRRWKWWLSGGLAGLLAVTVVGPFVFLHFIEKPAPPPLSLSSTPSSGAQVVSTTAAPSASFAGTYKIAGGSQVQYRVQEILFGQSADAVGSTSTVNGSLIVDGTSITKASFSVPLETVQSDSGMRDGQFRNRIMA